ncbi:peroxisomal carnitine O-octanoyltransferase [Erpetoichthys calabaricus]|uniref:peroxisomal carnitine O-octanoyltransferase n=1 Tax=Erpetoichthys calabaricus TaxID=27687 RepID=UPI0022349D75|nr:peroxisomal carnitine O-octanoyltransferase [Erpetoichthys calabaricus]
MNSQMVEPPKERTFQYQNSLPSLPVPSLEESLQKYLDAVKPFCTEDEFQKTSKIVNDFSKGIGKDLHQKLLKRAKARRNWLEEWWLNSAYLEVRIPSQLNVNFGGPGPYLEHYWPPQDGTQLDRACISVWYTLLFWQLLRTEQWEVSKAGTMPLDMNQFQMLYCTCKIPGITKDSIVNYFKTESEGDCPSHLVVMCRGRIFTFDTMHEGHLLSPPELRRQLAYIRQRCDTGPRGVGVSALTTEERTRWAKTREYLIELDPKNLSILETIQSALFILSLDDESPYATPENYSQIISACLTGDPTIRWGDKSYNMLSFANGTFGSNCDHSPYDAMVLVTMCHYIDQNVVATEGRWKGSEFIRNIDQPEELIFTVDQKVLFDIDLAKKQYTEQGQDLQVASYTFTDFGKAAVKQRKFHPDTFFQLALQLAYYRYHGHPGCCYETATTRRFYHGRTETMRPCTVESVTWCKSMLDPNISTEKKRKLLLVAAEKHNKLMNECQNGRGFDRHLLGLLLISKEEGLPTPDLYSDTAFTKSGGGGNFVLSTSLVGYTRVLGSTVPMVHHGYGCFYQIRDDRILATCIAWKSCPETDAEVLFANLRTSMQEMLLLLTVSQL